MSSSEQTLSGVRDQILRAIDAKKDILENVVKTLYDNPEMGHQERAASTMLADELEQAGFSVERKIAGMETSFVATWGSGDGPRIAILAEYDALPGIGHGCGHNTIAASALGAALGLVSVEPSLPGTLLVFGAPAEEGAVDNAGGKVLLVNDGCFKDVDAAMMIHPSTRNVVGGSSIAREAFAVSFKGKPAHAAGAPHKGINALDALIQTFNSVNALRQHVKDDVRIHGIITHGGEAPNIVPEFSEGRFYARAADKGYLAEVVEKIKNCARGAALATGAEMEWRQTANTYENMTSNRVLSETFANNIGLLGKEIEWAQGRGGGSTDMGNVSQVVPSIHPYVRICSEAINGHSREFADATVTPEGLAGMMLGAKALALSAWDLFSDPALLDKAKAEFDSGS